MADFIINGILWTLALYGLIEIIKTLIYIFTYTNLKTDGIYLIVAVKDQQEKIEGFLRTVLFRLLYGKEENIKEVIIADLDSKDETVDILKKLQKDYDCIKVTNWKDCKNVLDSIDKT